MPLPQVASCLAPRAEVWPRTHPLARRWEGNAPTGSVGVMRKYLFGSGLLTAILGGITLLRGLRSHETFTWRQALAWLSWAITLTLAIGAVVDTRRATQGKHIPGDSPIAKKAKKLYRQRRIEAA